MIREGSDSVNFLHSVIPVEKPVNFCVAPFISTMQTPYGKTSPCAYGITEWDFDQLTPKQRWESEELNQFRLTFVQGKIPSPCSKCINEEIAGKDSLRVRMNNWYPDAYDDMILSGKWKDGPQHLSTKVSNVCNLACRTCGGWDSNTFTKEGENYVNTYRTTLTNPQTKEIKNSNRFVPRLPPKHTEYLGFKEIDSNITKLEFYGGEPLLNLTHLDFLEHLIDIGRSQHTTLFYSTNCTQKINPRHKRIWEKFKKIEFSFSIDHIEDKFNYLRWPGDWNDVEYNIKSMLELKNYLDMSYVMSPCCTLLNAYYIDEVIAWGEQNVGSVYINMVANPEYLSVNVAPNEVKLKMLDHIKSPEVSGFIQVKPYHKQFWKQFIIWTKRQDLYRKQNFALTFTEFYNIIKTDWDEINDLSESSFYGN